MLVGFIVGAVIVAVVIMAVVTVSTDDERSECTQDIPCQECGMCYGDHFNASLTNGHPYVYPRDLHR